MKVIHWELGLSNPGGTSEMYKWMAQTPISLTIMLQHSSLSSLSCKDEGAPYEPLTKQEKSMDHRWVSSVVITSQKQTVDTSQPLPWIALKGSSKETYQWTLGHLLCADRKVCPRKREYGLLGCGEWLGWFEKGLVKAKLKNHRQASFKRGLWIDLWEWAASVRLFVMTH